MDDEELRAIVVATLIRIAPEVEANELRDNKPLRHQVDLDSMDWLHFLIGLAEKLKVEIAEADYINLVTLQDLLSYLKAKL